MGKSMKSQPNSKPQKSEPSKGNFDSCQDNISYNWKTKLETRNQYNNGATPKSHTSRKYKIKQK